VSTFSLLYPSVQDRRRRVASLQARRAQRHRRRVWVYRWVLLAALVIAAVAVVQALNI